MRNKKEIDSILASLQKLNKKSLSIIDIKAKALEEYLNYEYEECSDKGGGRNLNIQLRRSEDTGILKDDSDLL